jgi:hypothetical protein
MPWYGWLLNVLLVGSIVACIALFVIAFNTLMSAAVGGSNTGF